MTTAGQWVDNVFVTRDGDFMTVLPDGTLEIRGPGWVRRKKGMNEGADLVRVCKLDLGVQRARRIAEMVAEICYDH